MVIVVAGNNEPALRPVVYGCGAFLVRNPAPERGQFSSLQTGLREVLNRGRDSAMVTLVDRPPPAPETLSHLGNAFAGRNRSVWAIVPDYQGKHGHPILIGREMMEAFLKAPTAANAREIEHANQQRIAYVPTDDPRVIANVDTLEEYASLESRL
jgi:molybdenum cofactor cytidylyltransferase